MRTTIDLDDELLRTAKSIADVRGKTLSKVISELAWDGLRPVRGGGASNSTPTRNGFPVLPARPGTLAVTPEHVAELLNDDFDSGEAAG